MTINIQNASTVNVIGHHKHPNCKPVYNMTTNTFYASGLDIAKALDVDSSSVSAVLNDRCKTVKGMRICFVSKIMEHLEEINEINRLRDEQERVNAEKAAAYDAIMAERKAQEEAEEAERRRKAEAQAEYEKRKAKLEELRRQMEAEVLLLHEAEALCKEFDQ